MQPLQFPSDSARSGVELNAKLNTNMKANPPNADPALSHVLRAWKPGAELPPRFHDRVWQRIADADAHPSVSFWGTLCQWLDTRFRRPAVALAYVTVLMGVGLTTGYWHAQSDAAQAHSELKARYLHAVDPLQR
jgi:hypothetical protein